MLFPKIAIARCFSAKLENGVNGRNLIFPFQHLENTRRQDWERNRSLKKCKKESWRILSVVSVTLKKYDIVKKLENVEC